MATKNVQLGTEMVGGEKTIKAGPNDGNVGMKFFFDKLHVHNKLDGPAVATVTFYDFPGKVPGSELGGFCGNLPYATEYVIADKKKLDCEPDAPGYYTYMVTATEDHKTLDPVIIIKDSPFFSIKSKLPDYGSDGAGFWGGGGFNAMSLSAMLIPVLLLLVVGGLIGRNMKR